ERFHSGTHQVLIWQRASMQRMPAAHVTGGSWSIGEIAMKRPILSFLKPVVALTFAAAAAAHNPASAARPTDGPHLITLGTGGGPVIQTRRSRPANAVVVNGAVYLFDVGAGTLAQLAKADLAPGKVKAVFLSHHHVD